MLGDTCLLSEKTHLLFRLQMIMKNNNTWHLHRARIWKLMHWVRPKPVVASAVLVNWTVWRGLNSLQEWQNLFYIVAYDQSILILPSSLAVKHLSLSPFDRWRNWGREEPSIKCALLFVDVLLVGTQSCDCSDAWSILSSHPLNSELWITRRVEIWGSGCSLPDFR